MKKWIIILVLSAALLCLCASMVGIFWFSIQRIGLSGVDFRPVLVGAEATEDRTLEVSGPSTVEVRISNGDITINATPVAAEEGTVTINMRKTAYATNQVKAEEELENMQVTITQTGDTIRVVFEQRQDIPVNLDVVRSARVDLTIQVPAETEVTAYSGSGDVSISGTAARASISSDYGNLTAANITGGFSASTSSGKVEADGIQSGQSDINLKSDYGNIRLENADANAIQVHSSSGNIDLTNIEISTDLNARSDYGDLHLEQVTSGSADLHTSSGTVTVEGAGEPVKAHSDFGDISVTSGDDATIDLSSSSGSVEYSGTLGEGPHTLHSDYGSITLSMPAETALDVDLKTDYGNIKSAIPVTFSGDLEEGNWIGTINGGGESLAASTSNGDIRIEVLNP